MCSREGRRSLKLSTYFFGKEEKVKKGLVAVLAAVLFASVAMANETRVGTMGWNDALLWDEENIFWCPALAAGYPNEFILELGEYPATVHYPDAHLGVFLTNDEMASMGVLGVVVNRPIATVPATGYPGMDFLEPTPAFDLIYAKNMGSFGIGGMLSLARNSASASDSSGDIGSQSTMVIGFTPGASFAIGEKGSVDLGFGFEMNSFSVEDNTTDPVTTLESDGAMAIAGNLRAMLSMGEYVFVIPYVGFEMSNLNWKIDTLNITDSDGMMFGGGIGLNVMPFEETTVIAGFGIAMMSEENTGAYMTPDSLDKMSFMAPAFTFGAESRFNSWMTGRIGAMKTFFASSSIEYADGNEFSSAADYFEMALGLGMVFGDFTLDAELNENFLFQGPDFIGGIADAPNAKLTATYNFSGM